MDEKLKTIVKECTKESEDGHLTFPDVVKKLNEAGIERYHADLTRGEKTYYTPDGQSYVVLCTAFKGKSAFDFSPEGIKEALKAIQNKKINYEEFCKQIIDAGCVQYLVSITGKQTVYIGRKGENYTEHFPSLN